MIPDDDGFLPSLIDPSSVPRLSPGMKLRHDATRDAWVILGPERLFLPDDHAAAVLKLIDGSKTVTEIARSLATIYEADAAIIETDVLAMLNDLSASGAVRW